MAEHFDAIHIRHLEIEQDQFRRAGRVATGKGAAAENEIQRFLAILYPLQAIAEIEFAQRALGHFGVLGAVFHEQDLDALRAAHVSPPRASAKLKHAPLPTAPSPQTRPPWRATTRCTIASPTPVPANSSWWCNRWNTLNSFS